MSGPGFCGGGTSAISREPGRAPVDDEPDEEAPKTTFNWPGLGATLVEYLQNRDYSAVQGIVVVFALVVVAVSVVIDFVNAYIDPRIRY